MSENTPSFTFVSENEAREDYLQVTTACAKSTNDYGEWQTTIALNGRRITIPFPELPVSATESEENKIALRAHNAIVRLLRDGHAQPEDIRQWAEELILRITHGAIAR